MADSLRVVVKRIIDIVAAGLGLLLLAPLLALVALFVRLTLGSPVLFRQVRPGLGGKPFAIYKFRTMKDSFDEDGKPLHDAQRITLLGKFLRKASLDELPELLNVVKGDMSLVGPRPLLVRYLSRYTPEQARRHDVRPGITGWAQINGRNDLPFSRRLEMDVYYVDHQSLLFDMKILLLTPWKTVVSEGVRPDQDVREIDDIGLYGPDDE